MTGRNKQSAWWEEAAELAATGDWNLTMLGEHFGVSREAVRLALRKLGVQISKGEGNRIAQRHVREAKTGVSDEVLVAYANEHGPTACARRYGIGPAWLSHQEGYKPNPWRRSGITDDELLSMYMDQRMSLTEVCHATGLAISGAQNRLQKYGVLRPARPGGTHSGGTPAQDPERAQRIREMIREGKSISEIIVAEGVSPTTVTYWRKRVNP